MATFSPDKRRLLLRHWRLATLLLLLLAVLALVPCRNAVVNHVQAALRTGGEKASTLQRLQQYGPSARLRLRPSFNRAGVAYPPARLVLLGLKAERRLEIWAGEPGPSPLRHIADYPILAMSGTAGPKLRFGDLQVPEGFYRIESLNPNSRFHLSLRVNYPSAFDRQQAAKDGRWELGGDIMIHGRSVSAGCLAMGDPAVEELFVLASDTGLERIELLLAPCDLRTQREPACAASPMSAWVPVLYRELGREMRQRLVQPERTTAPGNAWSP